MIYRIYDLFDGSLDKHNVHDLVPCCDQDGSWAQAPQHPIDMYHKYKKFSIYLNSISEHFFYRIYSYPAFIHFSSSSPQLCYAY